mgnify:CR=1 FL=1
MLVGALYFLFHARLRWLSLSVMLYTANLALVVGSEGKGMSRLTKEACDFIVRMPMVGRINSLNASVAGSILMYESMRQRLQKKG